MYGTRTSLPYPARREDIDNYNGKKFNQPVVPNIILTMLYIQNLLNDILYLTVSKVIALSSGHTIRICVLQSNNKAWSNKDCWKRVSQ